MDTIGALLTRDLRRKIEEIIQVDQADEPSVHEEITEYIATDSIRDQYAEILKAIADAPADPHEGVGVWISGFFGSGKSSFAKNLGYALQHTKPSWVSALPRCSSSRSVMSASATCSTPSTHGCLRKSSCSRWPRSGIPGRSRSALRS